MVLEFLADGFEEIEALTPVDVLRRAGVEVATVSVGKGDGLAVTGSHGIAVTADMTAAEAKAKFASADVEMVILPGGMPGAKNLDEDETVDFFVRKAAEECWLAAICAAPMIPGKRGLLRGYRAACYPGWEDKLEGALLTGGRVEIDGRRITACGMGAATEFALALAGVLKGDEAAEKLSAAILAK